MGFIFVPLSAPNLRIQDISCHFSLKKINGRKSVRLFGKKIVADNSYPAGLEYQILAFLVLSAFTTPRLQNFYIKEIHTSDLSHVDSKRLRFALLKFQRNGMPPQYNIIF
jgi:hypothetical protein